MFDVSSVEPDLGLGEVDLFIPNDAIAVGIGISASEYCVILQGPERLALEKRSTVILFFYTILERHAESLARSRLHTSNSRIYLSFCHVLLQPRKFLVFLGLPHSLEFTFVRLSPLAYQALLDRMGMRHTD